MVEFDRVIKRRELLKGAVALGFSALVAGTFPVGRAASAQRLKFGAVLANGLDTVTLPPGFEWHVVASWGDPLWSDVPEFDQTSRGTAASQALAFGDNCDGMEFFEVGGRFLLAVNNEYSNRSIIYGNRQTQSPETVDDVYKNMAAHGLSIVELVRQAGKWRVVSDSAYNRRITPSTPMEIAGPARGRKWLKTQADPSGTSSLGTWANCGTGTTPWGTLLTCEEGFHGYFSTPGQPDAKLARTLRRYGFRNTDWGYGWGRIDDRFDLIKHPHEPHRVGYVVEIDPKDSRSVPKKRTALGRFKHENCEVVVSDGGQVVAYMGDDEHGEFIYRFVSKNRYDPQASSHGHLLDEGVLSVARFDDDGTGLWLDMTPQSVGMSQEEICIFTRVAASKLGATTMDRPEWVAANPHKAQVYCCLTRSRRRGRERNAGGNKMRVGGPNPREANQYGQIVRWEPDNGDHAATGFVWDLFVIAGNPAVHSDEYAGSANINEGNMFNSPDGLAFDSEGNLWIQTDGSYSNEGDFAGMGNNQMLMADIETGEIRRFLVGPKECEITGLAWSSDKSTMFVGIQHPGERNPLECHFPDGGNSVPRSAVIAITRSDGGAMG